MSFLDFFAQSPAHALVFFVALMMACAWVVAVGVGICEVCGFDLTSSIPPPPRPPRMVLVKPPEEPA